MKYGSVCSGIEAATVAWHSLGWEPQWFSEIEKFPSSVLAHHCPHVENLEDMTKLNSKQTYNEKSIDLLVGGTPCQSFSVAGLRTGLADERGNLSLEFVRILMQKRPRWFLWENVPGVLSSSGGADFAAILSAWTGRGIEPQKFTKSGIIHGEFYSVAWRVLDSQYFGVPQRRRRIFVVGHLGNDWRPPVAVLFERESLRRDFTPSRETREETSGSAGAGADSAKLFDCQRIGQYSDNGVSSTLSMRDYKDARDLVVQAAPFDLKQITNKTNRSTVNFGSEAPTMAKHSAMHAITQSFTPSSFANHTEGVGTLKKNGGDLGGGSETLVCHPPYVVRRLTPTECERLQGFPDGYTDIPRAKDTNRYAALGNSMTTNVMRWIGERIDAVDKLKYSKNNLSEEDLKLL